MTKEEATVILKAEGSITDGTFYWRLSPTSGIVYGTCGDGTCDMDTPSLDEWLANDFNEKMEKAQ